MARTNGGRRLGRRHARPPAAGRRPLRAWSRVPYRPTRLPKKELVLPPFRANVALWGRPNVLSLSRHVPSRARGATHSVAPAEPRKRRADERHVVGCCEELARPLAIVHFLTCSAPQVPN